MKIDQHAPVQKETPFDFPRTSQINEENPKKQKEKTKQNTLEQHINI